MIAHYTLTNTWFTPLTDQSSKLIAVTLAELAEYEVQHIFLALQGIRYGQGFCNHFDITDNILFYERDAENAKRYIRKTYLKQ